MMMHNCIYSFRQSFDSNCQFWPYQSGNQIFFPRIDNICSKVFIKNWSRSMPPGLWLPFLSQRSRVAEFRFSSKAAADPRMPFGLWVTLWVALWVALAPGLQDSSHMPPLQEDLRSLPHRHHFPYSAHRIPPFQRVSITRGALPTVADYVMRP